MPTVAQASKELSKLLSQVLRSQSCRVLLKTCTVTDYEPGTVRLCVWLVKCTCKLPRPAWCNKSLTVRAGLIVLHLSVNSTRVLLLTFVFAEKMASPQPPPGPLGNGSDGNGPTDKQDAAQPVVEILGGDAYAAVIVCALLLLNMTSGMETVAVTPMLCQFDDQTRIRLCVQLCFVLQFS